MPEIIVKLGDNIVQKYFFVKEDMRIGRSPENEIVVENLAVSRCHAVIEYENDSYVLTDLGSANGTHVNSVRIKRTEIMDRDVISIGKHQLFFYNQHAQADNNARVPTFFDVERTLLFEPAPLRGRLTVIKGRQRGTEFEVSGQLTTLGRGPGNNVRLTDWFVSREHATIERRPQGFILRDLGSWRHTMLNGEAIEETPLADGDTVQLGPNVQLAFMLLDQAQGEAPELRKPVEITAMPLMEEAVMMIHPVDTSEAHEMVEADEEAYREAAEEAYREAADEVDEATYEDNEVADEVAEVAEAVEAAILHALPTPEAPMGLQNDEPPFIVPEDFTEERYAQYTADDLDQFYASQASNEKPGTADEMTFMGDAPDQDEAAYTDGLADAVGSASANEMETARVETAREETARQADGVVEQIAAVSIQVAAESLDQGQSEDCEPGDAPWPASLSAPAEPAETIERFTETDEPAHANGVNGNGWHEAPAAPATPPSPELSAEVELWERALQNRNPIIRKQAARRLKQLTGREYAY